MKKIMKMLCVALLVMCTFSINIFALESDSNSHILSEIDKLEGYATQYIASSGSTLSSTELSFQYLRRNRYNDSQWNTLLGTIDSNFVQYVDSLGGIDIDDDTHFIDKNTKKPIDFIHMIAALNCYYVHGDTVSMGMFTVSTDYAGWAGDLLTYLDEINAYRIANGITDQVALVDYSNELLGTNKNSTFDSEDMYADLDALNLYKSTDIDLSDLSNALKKYYVDCDSTYNATNRVESARNFIGNNESTIVTKAKSLMSNALVLNLLVPGLYSRLSEIDYDVVALSFANYMLEYPYIELLSHNGIVAVGDTDLQIGIYESNLGVPNILLSNNICNAKVENDVLYIKPLRSGTVDITIKSFNNRENVTYHLTIYNVAPSIVTNLQQEYELIYNSSFTFEIESLGTNNVYTWYIGDSADGPFTELGVTDVPKLSVTPTMDMNQKYLKCVVRNDGNPEISSAISLIRVKDLSAGNDVKAGDSIYYFFALFIICLGVNLFYIKRKN